MSCLRELSEKSSEYFQIQLAIKEIFEIAYSRFIDPGEVQILIARNFGSLDKIDSSVFSEIKAWLINNWFRAYQLLNPETHAELMKPENQEGEIQAHHYKNWFDEEERKHRTVPEYVK